MIINLSIQKCFCFLQGGRKLEFPIVMFYLSYYWCVSIAKWFRFIIDDRIKMSIGVTYSLSSRFNSKYNRQSTKEMALCQLLSTHRFDPCCYFGKIIFVVSTFRWEFRVTYIYGADYVTLIHECRLCGVKTRNYSQCWPTVFKSEWLIDWSCGIFFLYITLGVWLRLGDKTPISWKCMRVCGASCGGVAAKVRDTAYY